MATVPRLPPPAGHTSGARIVLLHHTQPPPEDTPAEYVGQHRTKGLNARIIGLTRDRSTEALIAAGGTQDDVYKPRHAGGVG